MKTKQDWRTKFAADLAKAAKKAGIDTTDLKWEACSIDRTWGDRDGLVFFGATAETNERAARYFETWAAQNLRKLGVVGGYNAQESISFAGAMHFSRYDNGACGWYRTRKLEKWEADYQAAHPPVETKSGFATSYVYYPCAD